MKNEFSAIRDHAWTSSRGGLEWRDLPVVTDDEVVA
jgi:hypothetical protein